MFQERMVTGQERAVRKQDSSFDLTLKNRLASKPDAVRVRSDYPEAGVRDQRPDAESSVEVTIATLPYDQNESELDPASGLYGLSALFEQMPAEELPSISTPLPSFSQQAALASGDAPQSVDGDANSDQLILKLQEDPGFNGLNDIVEDPLPEASRLLAVTMTDWQDASVESLMMASEAMLFTDEAMEEIPRPDAEDPESVDVRSLQLILNPEAAASYNMDAHLPAQNLNASVVPTPVPDPSSSDSREQKGLSLRSLANTEMTSGSEVLSSLGERTESPHPESSTGVPAGSASFAGVMAKSAQNQSVSLAAPRLETLPQPFAQPGWNEAFSSRVSLLVGQGISSAHLQINPPELGPIEIHMKMDQDRLDIDFSSHHAAVREAVESSLPKLREMLAEHHIELVETSVSSALGGDGAPTDGGTWREASGERAGQGSASRESSPGEAENIPALSGDDPDNLHGKISSSGLLSLYA